MLLGLTYHVNVVTNSALGGPKIAEKAVADFLNDQSGPLSNSGGDCLGQSAFPVFALTTESQKRGRRFTPSFEPTFPPALPPHLRSTPPTGPRSST